ncbi:MAG TPA: DUF4149 domain-containing protein [Candidatus Polarisedimenticolia bacterium]|nr:DUF4149 domain-containing protein [Candidatus Polarisedimenticolia bacterium]
MTWTGRAAAVAQDLALGLLAGGIAGAALCATVLFQAAPSREVAGDVGNAIFRPLGLAAFALSLVLLAARWVLRLQRPASLPGTPPAPSLILPLAACLLSGTLAFYVTPVMTALWESAPHDPSGGGLMGEDRSRFMRLHGLGNLLYLSLLTLSAAGIAAGALRRTRPSNPD